MSDDAKKPDEEISLSGVPNNSLSASDTVPEDKDVMNESAEDSIPDMSQRHGEFAVTAGMTGTDLVDAIINAPTEQLIPWEDVELPSKGIFYNWTSGFIKVRAWGAQVDKILATQRLVQSGQSIDHMIAACCQFPEGFRAEDLLVGDQIFLLYYLRGITHGNIYEFAISSPSGTTSAHVVDLNMLATTITYAQPILGTEPFKVVLPYLSEQTDREVWVGVRFLRVIDTHTIARNQTAKQQAFGGSEAKVQKRKKSTRPGVPQKNAPFAKKPIPVDDALTQNLSTLIVNLMGEVTDPFKISSFVERLHSSDLATIREWLRDNSPGIETQVELTDPSTQDAFKVMLPITESFFRPQDHGSKRT